MCRSVERIQVAEVVREDWTNHITLLLHSTVAGIDSPLIYWNRSFKKGTKTEQKATLWTYLHAHASSLRPYSVLIELAAGVKFHAVLANKNLVNDRIPDYYLNFLESECQELHRPTHQFWKTCTVSWEKLGCCFYLFESWSIIHHIIRLITFLWKLTDNIGRALCSFPQ